MTATEHVILVDKNDQPIGSAEKMAAHQKGLCHRAFSVFLFRQLPDLQVLIQQRAAHKYHSPLLWTNTCCSHPRVGEEIIAAGSRRLMEEMGVTTILKWAGKFHYIAHFDNDLIENEIDHVLIGEFLGDEVGFNPEEVADFRWVGLDELRVELLESPGKFTPWFERALEVAVLGWMRRDSKDS